MVFLKWRFEFVSSIILKLIPDRRDQLKNQQREIDELLDYSRCHPLKFNYIGREAPAESGIFVIGPIIRKRMSPLFVEISEIPYTVVSLMKKSIHYPMNLSRTFVVIEEGFTLL